MKDKIMGVIKVHAKDRGRLIRITSIINSKRVEIIPHEDSLINSSLTKEEIQEVEGEIIRAIDNFKIRKIIQNNKITINLTISLPIKINHNFLLLRTISSFASKEDLIIINLIIIIANETGITT